MASIYIITSGDYSDYSIDSVWSDEAEAVRVCELRNRGAWSADQYRVEEHPLDDRGSMPEATGFTATYDWKEHGYPVDVHNVVVEEALFRFSARPVYVTGQGIIRAETKVDALTALKIVLDMAALLQAVKEGVTD